MKTTKGGKVMNPTDAYRKELRKKELKRNKKERKKVREVGILKKDPDTLKDQIEKLEMMKADGALDKARKHKKRQLEDTLSLVMKKRKEYEEKMREKGEAPVMFSHLGPPPRRRTTAEEEDRVKHPKPEDSVYFHPTLNPTGAPPPGKPPMYKSSIGPRIPLSESDGGASCSNMESEEEGGLSVLPPPPPPPPLPAASNESSVLPPLPPLPPAGDSSTKEALTAHRTMPPPPLPLIQRPSQPAPPGTENNKVEPDPDRATTTMLPPPPPPPGLPPKSANHIAEAGSSEDTSRMMPLLLPPLLHRPPPPSLQSDMMAVGITRFPPPPPPPLDMRPPLMVPGLSSRPPPPPPPGVFAQGIPRPPFAGLLRPPVLVQEDDLASSLQIPVPQKPSYVKSAASTVVKRPLAQHNPELTSMVPASVRVRRETAAPKGKPKAQPTVAAVAASRPASAAGRSETAKGPSIDESYMAFLEDMKSLGALEN